MPHSLHRLAERIYNTPHYITPDAFNVVLGYFDRRNAADHVIQMASGDSKYSEAEAETPYANGLGVLQVDGSLTYKPVMTLCGELGTSYQSLVEQVEDMAEAGVKTIIMEVTSGGGEASHCFESAQEIRTLCDENGITLIGYADTVAASAAYAIICVCDTVIANPSSCLGSIGCVVALLDTSKAMENAGLKRIFITSGENKVPFDADGSFKKSFLDEVQADVDQHNDEFAAHVSKFTGIDTETVKGFQAGVFNADEAVQKGLANAVMTNKEFAAYVAQVHKGTPQ